MSSVVNPTLRLDNETTIGTAYSSQGSGTADTTSHYGLPASFLKAGSFVLVTFDGFVWKMDVTSTIDEGTSVGIGGVQRVLLSASQKLSSRSFTDFATIDSIPDGKLAKRSGTGFVGADLPETTITTNTSTSGIADGKLLGVQDDKVIAVDPVDISGTGQPLLNYSTVEQDTGIKWFDGKKIYQQTIRGTWAIGTTATTLSGTSGWTGKNIVKIEGKVAGAITPIGGIVSGDAFNAWSFNLNTSHDWSITVWYTKA